MTYVEGFLIAVPTANKGKFVKHARTTDEMFMEHGARRIVEGWQEDVSRGHTNDFFMAVEARDDEAVVFSWIEWTDKATRNARMGELQEKMKTDPRWDPEKNPVPFDGRRMIYGGFQPIVEHGEAREGSYVQGFVLPVPEANKETYRRMADEAWDIFHRHGALRVLECWQDDVPQGKQTDFFRTVIAKPEEKVVFSWVEWPSREVCDAAAEKMQAEMEPPSDMPFDGKRMIYGGFVPVVELGE